LKIIGKVACGCLLLENFTPEFSPTLTGIAFSNAGIFYNLAFDILLFRKFVSCLIHFTKPIVAAVQGPAVGLGASTLCLCDVVLADENAWIQFPYPQQGLTPDGCASYLLPSLLNQSLVSCEALFCLLGC